MTGNGLMLGKEEATTFALVYLRRRSALEPITAHAFSDVIAMLGATIQAR